MHTTGPLSAKEQVAHHKWTKDCQRVTYAAETINLLSHSSTCLPLVRQLRLFLDCDGLICRGRKIHNPPLSESAKFPIHLFRALIVTDTHTKQVHSSVNATVTALRQSFWRPSIRQYVRKPLHIVWYVTTSYRDHPSSPQTPLSYVR